MKNELAQRIDHTLLSPDATKQAIDQKIAEAIEHSFASVCVQPTWVKHCARQLAKTKIAVCSVIGFPLGGQTIETKAFEAKEAINDGATEIDMVINIGRLKSGDIDYIFNEIKELRKVTKNRALLKVIIETALLTDEEKVSVCKIAKQNNVDFVKTSTGFSSGGATVEDVKLMKDTVGYDIHVKASGGIRTYEKACEMIRAGASRIGASSSVNLVKGEEN